MSTYAAKLVAARTYIYEMYQDHPQVLQERARAFQQEKEKTKFVDFEYLIDGFVFASDAKSLPPVHADALLLLKAKLRKGEAHLDKFLLKIVEGKLLSPQDKAIKKKQKEIDTIFDYYIKAKQGAEFKFDQQKQVLLSYVDTRDFEQRIDAIKMVNSNDTEVEELERYKLELHKIVNAVREDGYDLIDLETLDAIKVENFNIDCSLIMFIYAIRTYNSIISRENSLIEYVKNRRVCLERELERLQKVDSA